MIIKLSPSRRDDTLTVVKNGDVLTLNGIDFDLSPLPEGAILPSSAVESEWFVGDISRTDGVITLTLILPLPVNYSQAQAFPEDLVDVPDGEVKFPEPEEIKEQEVQVPEEETKPVGEEESEQEDSKEEEHTEEEVVE